MFFNSLKMKFAVIIGVIHMLFGIFLKGVNAVYFKNAVDIIFEFIPQVIFMCILFGYMIVMIFIKWNIPWQINDSKAPSIVTMLMNVFLGGGSIGNDIITGYNASGDPIYEKLTPLFGLPNGSQENFHFWVLVISAVCVPIMLLPKPIILYLRDKDSNHGFDKFIEEVI